jgi:NADH-quinone oxidoreductase subunit N
MSFSNLIELKSFSVFPEYFIGISILYILIVLVLISYSVSGLIMQKPVSECIGLILLLACYLILNDDLLLTYTSVSLYSSSCFYKAISLDYFGVFTKFTVCFFSSIYFFIISDFLKNYKLTSFEYLLILLFAVLGLILLCTSNDLLTAYLAIELISLASYILAAFKKTSSYSVEAGIKYLVTGAISSAFFLFGSSFLYAFTGSIYLTDFDWILFNDSWVISDIAVSESFIEIGLTLIIFSLFIKLSLAPFHMWSLDVYEGSPTISTFFFAVITKLSFFVFLVRIFHTATLYYQDSWQFYVIIIGFFSIFIGSFGGLRQKKLKTLLAYSSISHMGYALLAFSAFSTFGVEMLVFYLVIYMLAGLSIWFIIVSLKLNTKLYFNKLNKELGDFILLKKTNPALAISLALILFSIAGIPPLVGFLAKLGVFLSILQVKYYMIALLAILCSVISTFYYIRIIKILYFENFIAGKLYFPITTNKTILFSFSVLFLIFLFINPTFLYLIIQKTVWSSFSSGLILL